MNQETIDQRLVTEVIFLSYVILCAIWYYLYNLKNVKNTHGGVLILVKLQAVKLTLLHGCISRFLNCRNGTKSRNVPHTCLLNGHISSHQHLFFVYGLKI